MSRIKINRPPENEPPNPAPASEGRTCPKCGGKLCQPYKSTETGLWTQRCDKCEYFDSWAGVAEPESVAVPPQVRIWHPHADTQPCNLDCSGPRTEPSSPSVGTQEFDDEHELLDSLGIPSTEPDGMGGSVFLCLESRIKLLAERSNPPADESLARRIAIAWPENPYSTTVPDDPARVVYDRAVDDCIAAYNEALASLSANPGPDAKTNEKAKVSRD